MIHIYIMLSIFFSALIESWRIKAVHGRWLNVPKWVSVVIGAGLFGAIFWICEPRWWIIFEMIALRAALYSPILNKLRGLKLGYVSGKTNSFLHKLESRIGLHFWAWRVLYCVVALTFLIIYEL